MDLSIPEKETKMGKFGLPPGAGLVSRILAIGYQKEDITSLIFRKYGGYRFMFYWELDLEDMCFLIIIRECFVFTTRLFSTYSGLILFIFIFIFFWLSLSVDV